jgi:sec-independent protein translocase protein TatB
MFGIGAGEAAVILVIALLVVGPERLPVMIRDGARWLRDLKRMVDGARRDLSDQLGPELRDLGVGIDDLRDLDPRHFVRRQVLDGLDGVNGLDDAPERPARRDPAGRPAGGRPAAGGATAAEAAAPARFDPDTT